MTTPLIPTPAKSVRLHILVLSTHFISFQRSHIVETEPFQDTFGPKAQRKRPRLDISSFEELGKVTVEASAAEDEKMVEMMAERGRRKIPIGSWESSLILQLLNPSRRSCSAYIKNLSTRRELHDEYMGSSTRLSTPQTSYSTSSMPVILWERYVRLCWIICEKRRHTSK